MPDLVWPCPLHTSKSKRLIFDRYLQEFTTITDLASSVLPKEGVHPGHFSLEFGLVLPLFGVVLKCRHRQIRRKAPRLVSRAGREGLWSPKLESQLGRQYVILEEGIEDFSSSSLLYGETSGQEEYWRYLIPLQRRISTATAFIENSEDITLRMTFQRKIWNSDGEVIDTEDVVYRKPNEALQTPR